MIALAIFGAPGRAAEPPEGLDLRPFEHGQLCADHDRLTARLRDVCAALAAGELPLANVQFQRFRDVVDRHMRLEEEILFPKFCLVQPVPNRELIGELLLEHGRVRYLADCIAAALEQDASPEAELDELLDLLGSHEAKEEVFLYPMLFHLADPAFVAELFQSLSQKPAAQGQSGTR